MKTVRCLPWKADAVDAQDAVKQLCGCCLQRLTSQALMIVP